MSTSDKLKLTVWAAVHGIESTIAPVYPQRFPNIDMAKAYIKALCDAAKYDYTLPSNYNLRPSDPHHIVRTVKDRAWFLVAIRACDQGEFYLDEALPDRGSLRAAVESDIARALPKLLSQWPASFATADVAAKYIAGVFSLQQFSYTRFEDVAEDKFRAYVTWNTARWAWEQGRFELETVPRGWVRKAKTAEKEKKAATMAEAIESDIARLKSLIGTWPSSFTDLNAARNWVGEWCYIHRFRYTGWEDVELRKYKLFVNFNAAKYALKEGRFAVERAVLKRDAVSKSSGDVERGVHEQRVDEIEVIRVRGAVAPQDKQAVICEIADDAQDTEIISSDGSKSDCGVECSSCSSSPCTIDFEDASHTSTVTELGKQEPAAADPFKDLVAELQRGYTLKAAFD